ncbi:MAG TPA: Gfo/Idh/MocA family oxidoreductase [Puia sp.]
MKEEILPDDKSPNTPEMNRISAPGSNARINRRKFVEVAASGALAFTIVPRHVLGGKDFVAPSDKITLAYIGVGTQGIRELLPLLTMQQIQVTAVCDPNKEARGYRDWSKDGLRNEIRKTIKNPDWNSGGDNLIPGGRENGKSIVDSFYANVRPEQKFKGCTAYADFRELLDKEKDLDAVKVMTPDHLHGLIATAALKKNKHVLMHKPLSNRVLEGKNLIELARSSKKITHLVPWDSNGSMETVMNWINGGSIGTLLEVHDWTNRPVWPQYTTLPVDTPPVPEGLDWNLWLGPEADRPYSPNYTNMVFRSWYDFGGGSMADMGYYSLWTVFNALQLENPVEIEPNLSHHTDFKDSVPFRIHNDFSFPTSSTVRFKFPAKGSRPPVELCWYDGGMRPACPAELAAENKELPIEGMMFVGDKGKILAGFNVQDPRLLGPKGMEGTGNAKAGRPAQEEKMETSLQLFIDACKSGKQYPGSFAEADHIMEAINLYAVALRSGHLLKYDAAARQISNFPEANKYLSREYRTGWDPATI